MRKTIALATAAFCSHHKYIHQLATAIFPSGFYKSPLFFALP